jgi:phosphohistidine swiveling domain-containing protein
MQSHQYNVYAYQEETDLTETAYWIFGIAETPPGQPRTPMFDCMFMKGSNWGAAHACNKLSMPSMRTVAFRSYQGYQLMSVILPKEMPPKGTSSAQFEASFQDFLNKFDDILKEAKSRLAGFAEMAIPFNFENAGWMELAELFRKCIKAEHQMYESYFYFAEGLSLVYSSFVKLCHEMLGLNESDELFRNLLGGFDNQSYEVERGLNKLAQLAEELDLRERLLNQPANDILPGIRDTEPGGRWADALLEFLEVHGWRCVEEMEYNSPSWVENPALAIAHIQQYLRQNCNFELEETLANLSRQRTSTEEEILGRIAERQRGWFTALMKMAQKYAIWKVEHPYYFQLRQYAITRHVLLGIGGRLCETGCVDLSEDTMFLVPEEIFKALSAPGSCTMVSTVASRKQLWMESKEIAPPPMISKLSPAEVGRLITKSADPMAIRLMMESISVIEGKKADLSGMVSSSGVGEGPVRIIHHADQLSEVQAGEVLVAPAVRASWSAVFPLVSGIVTDRGGTLSNWASVGREYGIPVVTNVIEGTSKLKNGQRIRVDGSNGSIYVLDLLYGKKILVVDDEVDILDTLEDLLDMCEVVKASSFDDAQKQMSSGLFDIVVLDIMGVDGYKLLEIAKSKDLPAVMLTAHALSLEDTVKSYRLGAVSYVPKENLVDMPTILNDVLEAKAHGRKFWWRWFDRFGEFYERRFGPDWQNKYPEFLEMLGHSRLQPE